MSAGFLQKRKAPPTVRERGCLATQEEQPGFTSGRADRRAEHKGDRKGGPLESRREIVKYVRAAHFCELPEFASTSPLRKQTRLPLALHFIVAELQAALLEGSAHLFKLSRENSREDQSAARF